MRHFAQAFFAEQCEMNGGGEGAERLIRADVRRGLFTTNVLFARRECEHKSAAAFGVDGLACEASRHLPDELIARSKHADKWTAITRRQAEALAFHRDDVGFCRRLHESERDAFRNRRDKQ